MKQYKEYKFDQIEIEAMISEYMRSHFNYTSQIKFIFTYEDEVVSVRVELENDETS